MVAVTGGVDFLTLDVFRSVLGNKRFPLDSVLKENLGFLPLAGVLGDCFMFGVIGVCFMSGSRVFFYLFESWLCWPKIAA